jgi:hypothetical protein
VGQQDCESTILGVCLECVFLLLKRHARTSDTDHPVCAVGRMQPSGRLGLLTNQLQLLSTPVSGRRLCRSAPKRLQGQRKFSCRTLLGRRGAETNCQLKVEVHVPRSMTALQANGKAPLATFVGPSRILGVRQADRAAWISD